MAVAVNSKAAPYQTDKRKNQNQNDYSGMNPVISSTILQQNNLYADSPSRQLRRSTRVASLSPSSFTPLISDATTTSSFAVSGTSSASSSASSYMPASPSRKYSMMRGGYNGVAIDEITINEIEPENRYGKKSNSYAAYSASSYAPQQLKSALYPSLSLNSERKHPTLDFQPTNLSTPSTTLLPSSTQQSSSGITPSVDKINIQETPGQSNRILDKLVSRGDFEEIAKATPLGNKSTNPAVAKQQQKQEGEPERTHKEYICYNNNSHSVNPVGNNFNLKSKVQTLQSSNNMAKTPQKQTLSENSSDETVKVVRTLRNRSIIASPLPARRSSLSNLKAPQTPDFSNSLKHDLPVYFKKHQKNLLAYSLAALFILATAYHIYDGLSGVSRYNEDVAPVKLNVVPTNVEKVIPYTVPSQINKEDVVQLISQVSEDRLENIHEALSKTLEQKLTSVEERLQERLENIEKSRETENTQPQQKLLEAELQKKALESVASTVKKLEKKFNDLEARIEVVQKEISKAENRNTVKPAGAVVAPSVSIVPLLLKVVKHLSSKPLNGGFFKSSNFSPENALLDTPEPFKFTGNRGKFAVALPPNLARFPNEISLELPSSQVDRTCLPKDFEIWGLPNAFNERDSPVLLFRGTFDASKEIQNFKLKRSDAVKVLQLRIRNNHGNDKFTCLYRFKVLTSIAL